METWALFWKVVLYGALGLFALLSVWVTVAGVGDIKRMFAALRSEGDGDG